MGMIWKKVGLLLSMMCMTLLVGCGDDDAGKVTDVISDVEADAMSEVISTDFENNQVVRVVCENQSGSGVVYDTSDGQVVIVTAAHVVEGAESAEVLWTNSESAEKAADKMSAEALEVSVVNAAEIIRVPGLDLAFLRIEDAEAQWAAVNNRNESEENDFAELVLQGYDSAGELIKTSGTISEAWVYVEDFQSHMMIGKCEAVPGMSGGGAFTGDKFVGIICGMDNNNNVAILPASVLASEYDVIVR